MEESVGHLSVFFRADNESFRVFAADHIPSLVFVYNAGNRNAYASGNLTVFIRGDASDPIASGNILESIFYPAERPATKELLTYCKPSARENYYCNARMTRAAARGTQTALKDLYSQIIE